MLAATARPSVVRSPRSEPVIGHGLEAAATSVERRLDGLVDEISLGRPADGTMVMLSVDRPARCEDGRSKVSSSSTLTSAKRSACRRRAPRPELAGARPPGHGCADTFNYRKTCICRAVRALLGLS